MTESKDNYVLLTGTSNVRLADDIGRILGVSVSKPVSYFADGEIRIKGMPNLRKKTVFIIQSTCRPVNDSIIELVLMIDAARRASAKEIIAIMPYFGYARQDRKEQPRVPISASTIVNMISNAGADRILTVDIHSPQVQGFILKPWDNLFSSFALIPELKKMDISNLVIASPDKGGVRRATGYAELLSVPNVAVVYKKRDIDINNKSQAHAMIGDVKDKDVLIVDDMIDSGGTIFNAAEFLMQAGAKSVVAAVAHGLFTLDSLEKLSASQIKKIIITDTVFHREEVLKHPKITVVSVAPMLAEATNKLFSGDSLSDTLILKS